MRDTRFLEILKLKYGHKRKYPFSVAGSATCLCMNRWASEVKMETPAPVVPGSTDMRASGCFRYIALGDYSAISLCRAAISKPIAERIAKTAPARNVAVAP